MLSGLLVAEESGSLSNEPSTEDHGSDDAVCNDDGLALSHHLQTNATVYDTESQQYSPPPDMHIADNATITSRHEMIVVHPAQHGLNRQQANNNRAEEGVRVIEKLP